MTPVVRMSVPGSMAWRGFGWHGGIWVASMDGQLAWLLDRWSVAFLAGFGGGVIQWLTHYFDSSQPGWWLAIDTDSSTLATKPSR